MQTCQRCGGVRFFGSVAVGWGGPICNCQYPQLPNPDAPSQGGMQIGHYSNNQEIIERLDRIEKLLDSKKELMQEHLDTMTKERDEVRAQRYELEYRLGLADQGFKTEQIERAKSAKLVEALHMAIDESIKSGHSGLVIYLQQKLREHSSDSPVSKD